MNWYKLRKISADGSKEVWLWAITKDSEIKTYLLKDGFDSHHTLALDNPQMYDAKGRFEKNPDTGEVTNATANPLFVDSIEGMRLPPKVKQKKFDDIVRKVENYLNTYVEKQSEELLMF